MESKVILISAGTLNDKQSFTHKKNIENLYVNQGLLGLATVLKEKNYDCVMFQGDRKSIHEMIEEIASVGIMLEQMQYPIVLSVPSFYSLSWANAFAQEVKERDSNNRVIAGGRWVFDKNLSWAKINLILYAGETDETIGESRVWLMQHKELIKGVSINPLTIYLNGEDTKDYLSELEKLSGIQIHVESLYEHGYMNIDLSNYISLQKAKEVADEWTSFLMSDQDYEDLKKICYTPRRM